jgi:hypothetical protein
LSFYRKSSPESTANAPEAVTLTATPFIATFVKNENKLPAATSPILACHRAANDPATTPADPNPTKEGIAPTSSVPAPAKISVAILYYIV